MDDTITIERAAVNRFRQAWRALRGVDYEARIEAAQVAVKDHSRARERMARLVYSPRTQVLVFSVKDRSDEAVLQNYRLFDVRADAFSVPADLMTKDPSASSVVSVRFDPSLLRQTEKEVLERFLVNAGRDLGAALVKNILKQEPR